MTTHEVLVRARNLIEREGWAPYSGEERCVMARIGTVASIPLLGTSSAGSILHYPNIGAHPAARVLAEVVGAPLSSDLWEWNDAPGRTKEEVLAAFDEAIRRTAPPPADPLPRESYEGYCERTRREWDEPKAVPVP